MMMMIIIIIIIIIISVIISMNITQIKILEPVNTLVLTNNMLPRDTIKSKQSLFFTSPALFSVSLQKPTMPISEWKQ